MEDEAVLFRNLASITHRSMGGKADIGTIWKLKRDSQADEVIKPLTREDIEAAQTKFNKIFANGRPSN